ncbi:MAG: hypothetical protein D6E12_05960 [Desulfovibrio sp.]|nr:MAG: hypothetical protein D6E12_05960 [Desulfovibrio sp.]
MRAIILAALAAVICMAVLSGCNELKRAWKYTTETYVEYLEPVPTVDLDTDSLGNEEERRLSRLLLPVDRPVQEMMQYLDGTDTLPESEWIGTLFERFPWISGVMLVDKFGNAQFRHPSTSLKPVDLDAVLALGVPELAEGEEPQMIVGPDGEPMERQPWDDHRMRAMVQGSDLGPEVYVAYPFFQHFLFEGLTVVHFDPRRLLDYCPEPDDLIILAQGEVVSAGSHEAAATGLAAMDWESVTVDQTDGWYSDGATEYYWIARTLGSFHLVYAAPAEELEEPEMEEVSQQ